MPEVNKQRQEFNLKTVSFSVTPLGIRQANKTTCMNQTVKHAER